MDDFTNFDVHEFLNRKVDFAVKKKCGGSRKLETKTVKDHLLGSFTCEPLSDYHNFGQHFYKNILESRSSCSSSSSSSSVDTLLPVAVGILLKSEMMEKEGGNCRARRSTRQNGRGNGIARKSHKKKKVRATTKSRGGGGTVGGSRLRSNTPKNVKEVTDDLKKGAGGMVPAATEKATELGEEANDLWNEKSDDEQRRYLAEKENELTNNVNIQLVLQAQVAAPSRVLSRWARGFNKVRNTLHNLIEKIPGYLALIMMLHDFVVLTFCSYMAVERNVKAVQCARSLFFVKGWTGMWDAVLTVISKVIDKVQHIPGMSGDQVTRIYTTISYGITSSIDTLQNTFPAAEGTVMSTFNTVITGIANSFEYVGRTIREMPNADIRTTIVTVVGIGVIYFARKTIKKKIRFPRALGNILRPVRTKLLAVGSISLKLNTFYAAYISVGVISTAVGTVTVGAALPILGATGIVVDFICPRVSDKHVGKCRKLSLFLSIPGMLGMVTNIAQSIGNLASGDTDTMNTLCGKAGDTEQTILGTKISEIETSGDEERSDRVQRDHTTDNLPTELIPEYQTEDAAKEKITQNEVILEENQKQIQDVENEIEWLNGHEEEVENVNEIEWLEERLTKKPQSPTQSISTRKRLLAQNKLKQLTKEKTEFETNLATAETELEATQRTRARAEEVYKLQATKKEYENSEIQMRDDISSGRRESGNDASLVEDENGEIIFTDADQDERSYIEAKEDIAAAENAVTAAENKILQATQRTSMRQLSDNASQLYSGAKTIVKKMKDLYLPVNKVPASADTKANVLKDSVAEALALTSSVYDDAVKLGLEMPNNPELQANIIHDIQRNSKNSKKKSKKKVRVAFKARRNREGGEGGGGGGHR
jgi:hypothetical protein